MMYEFALVEIHLKKRTKCNIPFSIILYHLKCVILLKLSVISIDACGAFSGKGDKIVCMRQSI